MNIRLPNAFQTVPSAVQNIPDSMRKANPRTRMIIIFGAIILAVVIVWWLVMRSRPRRK